MIYFRYQRTIFATGEFSMDGFYAAGIFAISECLSLSANFFSSVRAICAVNKNMLLELAAAGRDSVS